MPFEIIRNDITKVHADAIVNAANSSLLGGGGVDGAIHRAAGPELLAECRTLGGCETGDAKVTKGYRLPCKYVIHTVGPIWQGGTHREKELLASCYRRSLELADQYGCQSVAFPLISAGVYGYPKEEAFRVAQDTILSFLKDHEMAVTLVVYDAGSFAISRQLYDDIRAYIDDAYVGPDYERREKARRIDNRPEPPLPAAAADLEIKASLSRRKRNLLDFIRPGKKTELPAPEKESKEEAEQKPPAVVHPAAHRPLEASHLLWEEDFSSVSTALQDYLNQLDEGFRDMLLRKIDESGMTDAECYKKANVDRKLFNKIKNQAEYKPGKSTVLAFAVALELPLSETEDMLRKAGFSLSHSSRFDLIVEYFIRNGQYDIYQINEALFAFDQKLLGSA